MKAAVIYEKGKLEIEEKDLPSPNDSEVLIKIMACGVCGTDNSLYMGTYPVDSPVIIGHEFSGVVVSTGKLVTGISQGDRVTGDPNVVCHSCSYCRSGNEHLCENLSSMGVHRDGAVAEYCVLPATNVYKITDDLSFEEAAFTEPLACAVRGIKNSGIMPGDVVLVIGGGSMGNLLLQCAKIRGASKIIVSEPIEKRRKIALENGADIVINPFEEDLYKKVMSIKNTGADVVIEAAGNSAMQAEALRLVKKGGNILYFGCSPSDKLIEVNPFIINENELHIHGSFNNLFSTADAVAYLETGKVKVKNLITDYFTIENYKDVFDRFGGKDTMKLMVKMD